MPGRVAWGSPEYLRNMARYWNKKSEELRAEYNRLDAEAATTGKDPYWWPTHVNAKALLADQKAAVQETIKYANLLAGECTYLQLTQPINAGFGIEAESR